MPKSHHPPCPHTTLHLTPSPLALSTGFRRATYPQRLAAATPSGTLKSISNPDLTKAEKQELQTFPAPVVLPNDDLALDPSCPPQSLRSWVREKDRNKITPERRTVYLAAPPGYDARTEHVEAWTSLKGREGMERPDVKHVLNYLEAFYHGLPVKLLDDGFFTFCPDNPTAKKKTTKGIGLRARGSQESTALRFRPTPNYPYSHQLNLDDLLDAAIASLPEDAYALLFLVNHDLYEDEEDEFCCGRAYGGSRVAVVSSARYCPRLDEEEGVEMGHAWPASCCAEYVGEMCGEGAKKKIVVKAKRKSRPSASAQNPILISDSDEDESDENKEQDEAGDMASIKSPMRAAISATQNLRSTASSPDQLTSLWLWRVARTASHELGHCFGIDHCTYYACIMQGSAGVVEDARQPPYLCLVDEGKVGRACGGNGGQKGIGRWVRERLRVLGRFCEERGENGDVSWACYREWIEKRLESMDGEGGGEL